MTIEYQEPSTPINFDAAETIVYDVTCSTCKEPNKSSDSISLFLGGRLTRSEAEFIASEHEVRFGNLHKILIRGTIILVLRDDIDRRSHNA
jgi:hypothetical protein